MLDLEPAARRVEELIGGIRDDQLDGRTPCPDYTVQDLLDHVVGLTVAFRQAADKEAGLNTVPAEEGLRQIAATNHDGQWRDTLPKQLAELVQAWRDPAAWEGSATAGGVELPAPVMATVALNELLMHGWDLAKATGQPYDCDEASAQASYAMLAESPESNEASGLFGPRVPVPDDAPLFDQALGLAGRDPAWTP